MTQRNRLVAIYQMRDFAASLIEETRRRSDHELTQDVMLWNGCLHLIQNVGEAASRVELDVQERFQAIPWRSIIGARNVIAHGYDVLATVRVLEIVRDDIPRLHSELFAVISELEAEDS